jgi:hypothetical protein
MRKILPILIATAVYLTPLYPVYAQPAIRPVKAATSSAVLTPVMMQKAQGVSDQMLARKDQMASKAAELRLKLQKFKDKNKARRVENINENLNTVNIKVTSQMQQNLTKISEIVAKLKAWVTEQEAAGKDVAAMKSTVANIESEWMSANTAVTTQAGNDYTVVVNTETTVKDDVKATRNDLRGDLKALHDKIISVRQSLVSTFSSWKGSNNGQ